MYSMFIFNCKTIQAKNVFYGYDNYKQPLAYNESQHTNFEIWDAPLGCERLQMCCSGRNYSCKSSAVDYFGHDTNALKFPKRQRRQLTKLFEFSAKEKFPTVLMKRKNRLVGRLIFPDTIALDKRGIKYAQLFGQGELLRIMEVEKIQQRQRTRRHISSEEYYIFGPEIEDLQSPERIIFERIRPIIRYSVLNKYLPLRIGKIRNFGAINDVDNGRLRVMYVTEANADCFCDTQCMVYDDCCHDYNNYCQPSSIEPCFYGEWSHWSTCQKTNTKDEACGGEGAQIRTRNILRGAQNIVCTQENMVFENRACFVECLQTSAYKQIAVSTSMPSFNNSQIQTSRPLKDITTVALLLDYRYNTSRMYRSKYHNRYSYPNSYHQLYSNQHKNISNTTSSLIPATFQLLPNDDERFDKTRHIFYCVHYELGWVNRNCAERRYKNVLRRRERICAECQPHAQLHRNTPKCASDLNDNEKGFWKLIGPLSCNGIWRRIARTNNCSCASNFPNDTAFLLV